MSVRRFEDVPMAPVSGAKATARQVLIGPGEAPNFFMRRFVMEPGGGMPAHTNSVEHEQYVLGGRAKLGIADEVFDVREGDVVFIPANTPHWYRVEGDDPFEFLCLVPNLPDRVEIVENN